MKRLLASHESALTADFQRVYNLRLVGAVRSLTIDEILAYIEWLPKDSAFYADNLGKGSSVRAHNIYGWGVTEDLLVNVIRLLQEHNYAFALANGAKSPKEPELLQNPAAGPSQKRRGDASAMAYALMPKS